MDDQTKRLDWLLSRIQLLDPPYQESAEGRELYQEVCKLVFEDQLYVRIWSEPTLNQLEQLFQTEKPNEELFEAELEEIRKRMVAVTEVNDCFFGIVDPNTTSKDLCELLASVRPSVCTPVAGSLIVNFSSFRCTRTCMSRQTILV